MKTAEQILRATGIYDTYGEHKTSPHSADKLRRFETGMNALIAREGFEECELVVELRSLLSDRIIELEMTKNWRLL